MKKWISKYGWCLILIIVLPIILIIVLHLGIALSQYTGVSLNIKDVTAKDWFLFMGSYLSGAITLLGVVLTIKHVQNVHNNQLINANIDKENDELAKAISSLNSYEPINIFSTFLTIGNTGVYNSLLVKDRINSSKSNINSSMIKVMLSTDIMTDNFHCVTCKNPCALKRLVPDFTKKYNEVSQTMFDTLCKIEAYGQLMERLISSGDASKINLSQLPETVELNILCKKCSDFMQKEIPQLVSISKSYIFTKRDNARKSCFENFKGGV